MSQSLLIHSQGWEDCIEARFLRASDDWQTREFRSHWHILRRLFDDIAVDAVVCIEGRPTVCLLDGKDGSQPEIEETRKKLWNLGATTLLVVERPHEVQVFSTIAKPAQQDPYGTSARLNAETIANLEIAEIALRVRQFVRRVETGAIYREHNSLFNPKDAVDQSLLRQLNAVRDRLLGSGTVENYRQVHALIGKFLFSCYLLDRGIIGAAYLKRYHLPEAKNMLDLLDSPLLGQGGTLNALFAALQNDFNGSLFGTQEEVVVTDAEAEILRRFLTGENLVTGQLSLFRLYDFSFIPVELISSIYQEFLGAEAVAEAPSARRNQPKNQTQRVQGAYYTPPRLAELTVDIATEDWDTLLDKRCLDPACGSGIFLVILFVRMAEEWRNRNPHATTEHQYSAMKRILAKNLCGVDINLTACFVTCFSLYLAFLDQMEPKEIMELREALEQTSQSKLLPPILWEHGRIRPNIASIHELDFFAMDSKRDFDLVIGNPPWVSRKEAHSAEAWLFSETNSFAKGLKKSVRDQVLFPSREWACAFMWKAGLHLHNTGRACQLLPTRVFLSNNTDQFQAAWLKAHQLEKVWLLADYSFILFPNADCPCFIGRYHPRLDGEIAGEFEFVTPKVEHIDPREALIPVQPEDQKTLYADNIITSAGKGEAARAWKQSHWGTPRDLRLVERLMRYPKLESLCAHPPDIKRDDYGTRSATNQTRWWRGQGFQPLTTGRTASEIERAPRKPWPIWWSPDHKFLSAQASPTGIAFLEQDWCQPYGNRPNLVRRTIVPELCHAPMLLINKACTKFLFSDFDVLFQDDFQSICADKEDEDELLFLMTVLSSPLAQYMLFHTTANIGIERDIARLEELLQLPFPLPEQMADREGSQHIVRECASLLRKIKNKQTDSENLFQHNLFSQEIVAQLNAYVYEYFGICEWERYLIEDTVALFRPSSTPHSINATTLLTAQPSRPEDRQNYANTLVSTFKGWIRTDAELWTQNVVAPKSGLALMSFGAGEKPQSLQSGQEVPAEERIENILKRIREASALPAGTVFQCLRGFALYEGTTVHLLKPIHRRHWTRTAALNDADSILTHMMSEGGWG